MNNRPIYCESCDHKVCEILRVTGVITGVGVLIFSVNRSRIGVGFCNFRAGLESESQKRDSGHLCFKVNPFDHLALRAKLFKYDRLARFRLGD